MENLPFKKTRQTMDNLPPDLVYEILLRLPVTTLGIVARHVCRSWRSIISNPIFIDQHTRSVSSEDAKTLLFQQDMSNYNEGLVMYTIGGQLERIRLRHQIPSDVSLQNTVTQVCNGMILYVYRKDRVLNFYLCNPILDQCVTLPRMETTLFNKTKYCTSGFGYDSITKEYKVVLVFENLVDEVHRKSYLYCCTINPGTDKKKGTKYCYNCWREVGHIDGEVSGGYEGLFVDGKLHWFLYPPVFEAKILSFDLNTETLKLEIFSTRDDPQFVGRKLLGESSRGKLCVHVGHDEGPSLSTVWVKKDEDVGSDQNSNWVEESNMRNNIRYLPDYCGPWKDNLFVYHGEGDGYVIMNKTNVIVDVIDFGGFFLSSFVPTLISLSRTDPLSQHDQHGDVLDMELD